MKEVTMFCVVHPDGYIQTDSLRSYRWMCLKDWTSSDMATYSKAWKEWSKCGWKCKKVTVKITIL